MATIPVGYFGGNEQARPDANLDMLSKMRIVVIEKWEGKCWNECLANQTAGQMECDPGCRQEDIELATLTAVKKRNPKVAGVFYINSWFDFQFYDLHKQMADAGYLLYDHDTGKVAAVHNDNGMSNVNVFDFTQKGARDLWVQNIKNLVATGFVDGIFADKYVIRASNSGKGSTGWSSCNGAKDCVILTQEQALAYNSGKEAMLQEMTDFLGPDALFWYSTTAQLKKVENKSPQEILNDYNAKKDTYKYLYMQTQDQHSNHDPTNIESHCDTEMIAKYMLIAEPGVFLGCNGWDERFSYPLGNPMGPMQESNGGKLSRTFSSGTSVTWDPKASQGSRATISWANTPVPTPSPMPTPTPTPAPTPSPSPGMCGEILQDISSSSGDLKMTSTTDTLEDCCALCIAEPKCKAWTWYSDGTGKCHLRDSLAPKSKSGRISGVLPSQVMV